MHLMYNPQMKSAYNFVPGIMGLIFILICAIMTSVSIVREKETGTMEVLLASPVRPIRIILAKMIPYFALSCINLATILLLARYALDVPISGSTAGIVAISLLYLILALALGHFNHSRHSSHGHVDLRYGTHVTRHHALGHGIPYRKHAQNSASALNHCSGPLVHSCHTETDDRRGSVRGRTERVHYSFGNDFSTDRHSAPKIQRQTRITMRTLLILLDKEFRQFIRNSFLPKVALIFPLMIMLVMPWVMTLDVRHIGIAIIDNDRSSLSNRLIRKTDASDYFTLISVPERYDTAFALLEKGDADVIIEVPNGFEQSILLGNPKRMRVTANGVNALKGNLGSQYAVRIITQTLTELQREQGIDLPSTEPIVVENRYNPTLEYRNYMIPALMIMLLIMLCGFLPSLNLVGEKETGTIEQINVTPVGRFTFTLAKLIPYWIIGLVVLSIAMLLAYLVYGLSPVGSLGAIYLAAALFVLTMSGLGVTIANGSSTMQQAMFVMFFFVMIFVLMSGLITPVASMPEWAQWITRFLPPRYFIEIMQAVYLKGTTVKELWANYTALTVFAIILNLLATLTYKKRS